MGNETSQTNDPNTVTIRKDVLEKNRDKLLELERESLRNKFSIGMKTNEILTLTHINDQLEKETNKLRFYASELIKSKDEALTKCEELEKRNEALKSELAKYESLPALKQIQELYENLQVFRQDIQKIEAEVLNAGQGASSTEKISDKKKANARLHSILEQKSLDLQQQKQLKQAEEQLTQAEKKLERVRLNSRSFSDHKQNKVTFIKEKIKGCMNEFDDISESINKIEEQIKDYQRDLTALQNKSDRLKEQERQESENILTILDMHHSAMRGIIKSIENVAADDISEISEAESVFLTADGKRRYAIILYNLKESPYDHQKVIDIINSICSISTEEIEVLRIGVLNTDKIRPIKVFVPKFTCVSTILSNRWKLKTGNFQYIRIVPFNKKKAQGKTNNPTKYF